MMKTIELEKEEIYCGNLLLVNKNYPLRDNNVKGLVPADVRFPNILMKRDVANVLQLIFEKISAGNSIVPVSGYRSLEEQTAIYDGSKIMERILQENMLPCQIIANIRQDLLLIWD